MGLGAFYLLYGITGFLYGILGFLYGIIGVLSLIWDYGVPLWD